MPTLLGLVERGVVDVGKNVTRRYSIEQAQEAYEALDRHEIVGRAIVSMPTARAE